MLERFIDGGKEGEILKELWQPQLNQMELLLEEAHNPLIWMQGIEVQPVQREPIYGDLKHLAGFISKEPQKDDLDRFRYLLTSGVAVEAITGASRYHHDTDLVLFDYRNNWWEKYFTDNVRAQKYWAGMSFDPAYLEETAWEANFKVGEDDFSVFTVHPAIIMTQKLSNAWGRNPRVRDLEDSYALADYWVNQLKGSKRWNPVIETAIQALPEPEREKTKARLHNYLQIASLKRTSRFGDPTYFFLSVTAKLLGGQTLHKPLVQACDLR